jgi:hypothetical protein
MDATTLLILITGLLIRLVIPILLTMVVVYGLRKLDDHWKREAAGELVPAVQARNIGCWDINKCSAEKLSSCAAYANKDKPCWQVFRQEDGHLQERCLFCEVFRRSPIPAYT